MLSGAKLTIVQAQATSLVNNINSGAVISEMLSLAYVLCAFPQTYLVAFESKRVCGQV